MSRTQAMSTYAGALIKELRTDRGLTPEALSYAIFAAGNGHVSARTIRRVEAGAVVPRVRAQFAIASFFDRPVTSIWPVVNRTLQHA